MAVLADLNHPKEAENIYCIGKENVECQGEMPVISIATNRVGFYHQKNKGPLKRIQRLLSAKSCHLTNSYTSH